MKSYQAARLIDGIVTIVTNSLPESSDNAVFIKLLAAGICRSDIKEISRSRKISKDRGPLFGHEVSGVIHFAGKKTGFEAGTNIVFNPNVTQNRTTGFAEYMTVIDSRDKLERAIIPHGKELDPYKAIFAEPFACTLHSLDHIRQAADLTGFENKRVAVIGAGNSGMSFGLLLKHKKAKIKIFNIDDGRLEFAAKIFPERELILLSESYKFVDMFDVVIVCTTLALHEVLKVGYSILKPEGIFHISGGTQKQDRFLDTEVNIDRIRRDELMKVITYQGKKFYISGAYGFKVVDLKNIVEILDKFPLVKIISKQITLSELPQLIMDMAAGKSDFPGKIIVKL